VYIDTFVFENRRAGGFSITTSGKEQRRRHSLEVRPALFMNKDYQVRVSCTKEDPAWDTFLATTLGGHYVQTSLWGKVKAQLGWRTARVIVTYGEHIVAGAQLLIRSLPLMGAIAYVPRGPLVAINDYNLTELVIHQLHQVARANGVQYLAVQPPDGGEALAQQLPTWRFQPSSIELAPAATILLDLHKDLDDILVQMRDKTRYNIRLGQRKGIVVREGTQNDLPTFYHLLRATSKRQNFFTYSEAYFSNMWRIFGSHQYIKLFLAEYRDEPISALLAIAFGNTLTFWRGGWSGHHGSYHPNEVMHWAAIKWAKSQGYRFYDFEGIEPRIARSVLLRETIPNSLRQTPTFFKLGFGGQVTLLPVAYEYIYNSFLRWAYTSVLPKVASKPLMTKVRDITRGIHRR
jgi:peptidoglycan pentaglycine glycine transferase (the first glycine)